MKVLAVGASGATAGLVCRELANRGLEVRGLVHADDKAQAARDNGAAEVVTADLTDLDALTRAAQEVDGVFGIIPAFAPDEAAIGTNLVAAAASAGVSKFVFSGVYHPSIDALSNHRNKRPAEEALYASDLDFTVLQPAVFMSQLATLFDDAKRSGTIAQPYSADATVAYVDYADVAEVAAAAFDDERMAYGTFELAASGMFSRNQLAELMSARLGRPVTAEAPDFESWADGVGMPAGPLRDGLKIMNADYDEHGFHGGNSLVLSALLGRDPVDVPTYLDRLA